MGLSPDPASQNWGGGAFLLLLLLLLSGCAPRPAHVTPAAPATLPASGAATETLALGVTHRAIPVGDGGVDMVEVDLTRSRAKLTVQTEGITRAGGVIVGQARTPHEWLTKMHALAAVNGGYFGMYEDREERKDFVGLLVQKGRVRHAAPPLHGAGSAAIKRGQYVRSAFGLMQDGTPSIAWAASDFGQPQSLHSYAAPMGRRLGIWPVWDAVGCGPTLISAGQINVTQSSERLASPGPRPRTFVAYDGPSGKPRHFVFGIASGMTFPALAAFLHEYFPRYTHSAAQSAMCLDGGASTQLSYRFEGQVQSPMETGVTVPDALVLLPDLKPVAEGLIRSNGVAIKPLARRSTLRVEEVGALLAAPSYSVFVPSSEGRLTQRGIFNPSYFRVHCCFGAGICRTGG